MREREAGIIKLLTGGIRIGDWAFERGEGWELVEAGGVSVKEGEASVAAFALVSVWTFIELSFFLFEEARSDFEPFFAGRSEPFGGGGTRRQLREI